MSNQDILKILFDLLESKFCIIKMDHTINMYIISYKDKEFTFYSKANKIVFEAFDITISKEENEELLKRVKNNSLIRICDIKNQLRTDKIKHLDENKEEN